MTGSRYSRKLLRNILEEINWRTVSNLPGSVANEGYGARAARDFDPIEALRSHGRTVRALAKAWGSLIADNRHRVVELVGLDWQGRCCVHVWEKLTRVLYDAFK
jgi:hypothetical protein